MRDLPPVDKEVIQTEEGEVVRTIKDVNPIRTIKDVNPVRTIKDANLIKTTADLDPEGSLNASPGMSSNPSKARSILAIWVILHFARILIMYIFNVFLFKATAICF